MTTTCSKRFHDIPFAHRAPDHDGHCAWLHGHNWAIEVTFACAKRDECGFVIDFGKLKFLKQWIDDVLDHAMVLNRSDDVARYLRCFPNTTIAKVTLVSDCSCEGLAEFILGQWNDLVKGKTKGRAWIDRITLYEDSKNWATAINMDPIPDQE